MKCLAELQLSKLLESYKVLLLRWKGKWSSEQGGITAVSNGHQGTLGSPAVTCIEDQTGSVHMTPSCLNVPLQHYMQPMLLSLFSFVGERGAR